MKASVRLMDQALEEYNRLKETIEKEIEKAIHSSENQTLFRSINEKLAWLKENPLQGEVIKKKDIPKELDVDNLFKMRLAQYWRMLYTIRRNEIEVICFILVIESHPEYDKQLKVRKR